MTLIRTITTIQQTVTMQTTINEYTGEFRTASHDNAIAFSASSDQGQGDLPPEKLIKSEITYGKM